MSKLLIIESAESFSQISATLAPGALPLLPLETFRIHAPAAHLVLVDNGNVPVARCSVWINSVRVQNQPTGVIGHFEAATENAGQDVVNAACAKLKEAGCKIAIGPMDGNTWRSYRHVTDRGSRPAFFLEPQNPPHYPLCFTHAGFEPLAEYYSAITDDLMHHDPRTNRVAQRLQEAGVNVRPIDMAHFERDAQQVFELSLKAFSGNYLYTPIDQREFLGAYAKVKPYVQPGICLLAAHGEKIVGFVFCMPDLLQAKRGEAIDTVIVKTLAVDPARAYAGLGGLLLERAQHAAATAGMKHAIHALMHQDNKSRNVRGHGPNIRRYTLFAKSV